MSPFRFFYVLCQKSLTKHHRLDLMSPLPHLCLIAKNKRFRSKNIRLWAGSILQKALLANQRIFVNSSSSEWLLSPCTSAQPHAPGTENPQGCWILPVQSMKLGTSQEFPRISIISGGKSAVLSPKNDFCAQPSEPVTCGSIPLLELGQVQVHSFPEILANTQMEMSDFPILPLFCVYPQKSGKESLKSLIASLFPIISFFFPR